MASLVLSAQPPWRFCRRIDKLEIAGELTAAELAQIRAAVSTRLAALGCKGSSVFVSYQRGCVLLKLRVEVPAVATQKDPGLPERLEDALSSLDVSDVLPPSLMARMGAAAAKADMNERPLVARVCKSAQERLPRHVPTGPLVLGSSGGSDTAPQVLELRLADFFPEENQLADIRPAIWAPRDGSWRTLLAYGLAEIPAGTPAAGEEEQGCARRLRCRMEVAGPLVEGAVLLVSIGHKEADAEDLFESVSDWDARVPVLPPAVATELSTYFNQSLARTVAEDLGTVLDTCCIRERELEAIGEISMAGLLDSELLLLLRTIESVW